MKSSRWSIVLLIALAACKHTGASSNDASAKSDAVSSSADAGTSTNSSMTADAGMSSASSSSSSSSGMSMSADAGTAGTSNGSMGSSTGSSSGSMGSSSGATTASDAARSAAANGTAGASDAGRSSSMGSSSTGSSSADAGSDSSSSAKLTDAQIAGITAAAHQSEIDAAKLARKNSKNAKVRAFASKMIKEHTAAMKEETALAKKANLTPEDSDQQSKLKQSAQDSASKLEGQKGRDFDKAYVQAQVDAHQQVLDMIDNTLLPAAQSADLKAQLQKERPIVQSHLEHAQKLAADLGAK
jgi:putative membrane protein